MGACVSSDIIVVHQISKPNQIHDQNHNRSTTMDYSAPASKLNGNFIIAACPICEKPSLLVTRPMPLDVAVKYRLSSAKFRSFGSNEDVFFESQPWLESDGDDEFYSLNGDLTPSIASSASNTPHHKCLSAAGYKLTLSPVKKRKSLSELFKEDEEETPANSNHETSSSDDDSQNFSVFSPTAVAPNAATSKPHFPQHTFANNNVDVKVKKDGAQKSAHHCFPRLFSVHNPNMAKKNSVVAA